MIKVAQNGLPISKILKETGEICDSINYQGIGVMKNETILSYLKWNKIDPHVVTCSNFKLIIHLSVS